MFKYEMHLHNSGCSACGKSTAREMIDAAREKGYSGVVFTNHFYRGNTGIDRSLPWADFVGQYNESYIDAKEYAKQFDIDVLFGVEEKYTAGKEALIYGLSPEVFALSPEFADMDLHQMAAFVRKNGGIIVCAHPYRVRSYIPDPDRDPDHTCFDGVEVYNSHNTEEENAKAMAFALKHGLLQLSGGDTHTTELFGGSGIAFKSRIKSNKELISALKTRDYSLITG